MPGNFDIKYPGVKVSGHQNELYIHLKKLIASNKKYAQHHHFWGFLSCLKILESNILVSRAAFEKLKTSNGKYMQ